MNRNVINYLLHTTTKRAARQICPSYFGLLASDRDHSRPTWWLDRLKDVESFPMEIIPRQSKATMTRLKLQFALSEIVGIIESRSSNGESISCAYIVC